MNNFFSKILFPLESKNYRELVLILFLTIISAILEMIGIGLVIPILNIFVGNDIQRYTNEFFNLNNYSRKDLLILVMSLFGLLYIIKFIILRLLILKQFSFRHDLFVIISRKLFKKYLYENYIFHIQNNTSKLIRNIIGEANLFSMGVVLPLVTLISEIIIFFSICTFLLFYDFQSSLVTICFISFFGFIILKHTNYKLKLWGQKRQYHSAETLRHLQQGFSSIREIILNGLQEMFLEKYNVHNTQNAQVSKKKDTTAAMPRLILELIGISTILILIFLQLNFEKNISEVLVIVGVFLYAALRLLPNISKIVQSIQSIRFNTPVIDLVFNELNGIKIKKKSQKNLLKFNNISFDNVCFSYPDTQNKTLQNINFEINKGEKIAILGKTGSGKSTLINLFCGLINQETGNILINSNTKLTEVVDVWRNSIGYVPQTVSIMDESILFNITLEEDNKNTDIDKVNEILKMVDLYDHIYKLKKNVNEYAGEEGAKLSVGQCQRLGIARALYRKPSIIVLDEATSSLDEKTENYILENLFKKNPEKTILFISHRPSALKFCERFFEVNNNTVNEKKTI